jgi:uncharacterized protein (TIGR03435 family)
MDAATQAKTDQPTRRAIRSGAASRSAGAWTQRITISNPTTMVSGRALRRWSIALLSVGLFAQAPAAFEAASVKPASAQSTALHGGPGTNFPGQLTGVATLRALIERAYEMKPYQISAPGWMDSARYEIAAKIPQSATKQQADAMLRTLLTERFHLAAHRETKEMPILELVIAKNGPKLRDAATDQTPALQAETPIVTPKFTTGGDGLPELAAGTKLPRSYRAMIAGSDGVRIKLWAREETTAKLGEDLSSYLNRPVFDRTGLEGHYDFTLDWAMDTAGGGIPRAGPPPDMIDSFSGPIGANESTTIFAALQSQIGLRLDQKRGSVQVLIVDGADKVPAGN